MSMVPFATKCHLCGVASAQYSSWATCRRCDEHCCPKCSTNPGSIAVTYGELECDGEAPVATCRNCSRWWIPVFDFLHEFWWTHREHARGFAWLVAAVMTLLLLVEVASWRP